MAFGLALVAGYVMIYLSVLNEFRTLLSEPSLLKPFRKVSFIVLPFR